MALDEMNNAMPPEELKELNEKNLEGKVERICWENQQRKDKLVVDLWRTSQNLRWNSATTKWLNSWEERRNAKLHFPRKWRIICSSRREKKRYLNSTDKILMNSWKNELNHKEPPWRTLVTKRWWDRKKGERIRLRPCDDSDGASRQNQREAWNSRKEKTSNLEPRNHSSRTIPEEKN